MSDANDPTDAPLPVPIHTSTMEKLEAAKRVSPRGADYWRAREICPILGYEWRRFEDVIGRAMAACSGVGIDAQNHFAKTGNMVTVGSGASRKVPDYFLTRGACYLVAMNGDSAKPEIAAAQAYFTVQTRRMELRDQADASLDEDERRLELRARISTSFKKVSGVAQEAGVRSIMQPAFHDARYHGLYGMASKEVKQRKGLADKDNLFDRAGPLELSANDFQMNLAATVISREGIGGEQRAIDTNRQVGSRVRKVIKESGSPLPEDLPLVEPIKEIETRVKKRKQLPPPD
jgi:DNA-damage-inducible protein D